MEKGRFNGLSKYLELLKVLGTWLDSSISHFQKVKVLVTQSCLSLCNPVGCSPPGSSVHGILQGRILQCENGWFFSSITVMFQDKKVLTYRVTY